ncbi:hypothetical protein [Staphylococcus equorum]|uniref:hypothetical protein n=1 Tax=Staphylococcus equorum TaxID=246432 RepID=UPI0008529C7D|nr:hypothetical protein [Staphylococcus equorum]OEK73327.1 hypothetical protein AST05_12985 [Staphylococcus equorum]
MKILEINNGKSKFIVEQNQIYPVDLSRDNLLTIMNEMYTTSENIEIPTDEELNTLHNPVEREIVEQIIHKIADFKDNITNIKHEVEVSFPDINN